MCHTISQRNSPLRSDLPPSEQPWFSLIGIHTGSAGNHCWNAQTHVQSPTPYADLSPRYATRTKHHATTILQGVRTTGPSLLRRKHSRRQANHTKQPNNCICHETDVRRTNDTFRHSEARQRHSTFSRYYTTFTRWPH